MSLLNVFVIIGAVVILLALWVVAGLRHLQNLKKPIADEWELLDEGLRKRHDLIPNLVETIRGFVPDQEKLLEKFIRDREHAAREYCPCAKKIEYEHELSMTINEGIGLGKDSPELGKDTNFLELKKEINDLEMDIEVKSKKYNSMVRYYNKHRKIFILMPLATIFRYGNVNIFEMER